MTNKILFILLFILILGLGISYLITDMAQGRYETKVIAQVISAEACGEGQLGQFLVANTIMNRARLWKKTPYEIVTQPKQYKGINNPNKLLRYEECKYFADYLAVNIMNMPDLSNSALYFRQPSEAKEVWHKEETIRWKNHIFYK